jgi:cobaltochelatase CobS
MTSPAVTPVEDLVKRAIMETIEKRKGIEAGLKTTAPTYEEIPVEEAPVVVDVPLEIKPDQVSAASMFKSYFKLLPNKDFGVTIYKPEDYDPIVRGFIPEVDPNYVLPADHVCNILKAWESKEKVLIHGPTGAGKTSLIEQLCAHTVRPVVRINASGDMDSSMMFGNQVARDGATYWVDGTITEAVKYGAVFIWDEWDVTPPEISMGLQWILEEKGRLFLKEKPGSSAEKFVTPDDKFRLVALGNTRGQGDFTGNHSGTNVQNTAALDRFLTTIHMNYMSPMLESKMLTKQFPSIDPAWINLLIQFANEVRKGYEQNQLGLTMSPRALFSICKKEMMKYSRLDAISLVYFNKLSDTHQKVAKELARKVFGTLK